MILINFSAFAEVDLSEYTAIPMREQVNGWDSPGFYLNIPHKIDSFGNWGDYWRTANILETSSTAYTLGDKTAPFIKILTQKGEQHWVFGGDIIIASTDTEKKKGLYHNRNSGHQHAQIFCINDEFSIITSSSSYIKFKSDDEPSDSPFYFSKTTSYGETSVFQWDKAEGNFFVGTYDSGNENKTEYDYESNYSLNLDLLEIEKVVQPADEWFWHFYNTEDYESILELKAKGYIKYDHPNIGRKASPFFKSIEDRDYEMIKFLLDNGFSQTVDGGNYDATVSCLWSLIENDDYEMIEFLLDAGVEKNTGGEMGTSWDLSHVIRYSTPQMLKLFIDGGYDATRSTYNYSNGEDSGGSGNFLYSAIYFDKIEMVRILIEEGVNVNFLSQSYSFGKFTSRTPLEAAKSTEMKTLLKSYGAQLPNDLTMEDYRMQGLGLSGKMNDTRVRYRNSPGTGGEILGIIDDNEALIVIDSRLTSNEDSNSWPWLLVRRSNGEFGWVYGEFVDVSRGFVNF